jgi:pyruvate/2-oxoglutarate dehydrogenase complex dihydrolipoamide acyltransferase (E2) component
MRRCGRAACLIFVGLLVVAVSTAGTSAAAGGQGKGRALAKGHAKHDEPVATPHAAPAAPQAAATRSERDEPAVAAPRKQRSAARQASPPGGQTRHNHLTICHATGNGGYVVISPNVNGALHGHLRHHDDFVYVDGCERPVQTPEPGRNPEPPAGPSVHGTDPGSASGSSRELPFTGLPVLLILIGGGILTAAGLALRYAWGTS